MYTAKPILTAHLLPILDTMLLELLRSLHIDDWAIQTIAKQWKVKDVAAHLLDGNLRGLSTSRDGFFGEKPAHVNSYEDLVYFLNELNSTWVKASKRLSPKVLIDLLDITGREYADHLQTLNPYDTAIFPVAWAGQQYSENWFHIAREFTEKFLHQQQIRDALNNNQLLTSELYTTFLHISMYALPHTFRGVPAETGTIVSVCVRGEFGGTWSICKENDKWVLIEPVVHNTEAIVELTPNVAWKVLSKGINPDNIHSDEILCKGHIELGKNVLKTIAVMA